MESPASLLRIQPSLDLLAMGNQPHLGLPSTRLGRHRTGALDRPLRLAPSNPAKNLVNLPHPDLPVRHLRRLLGS